MSLTCFDLIFESVLAVHKELVKRKRLVRDGKVNDFLELLGVVEVKDLGASVILHGDVVQQNLHNTPQELSCLGIRLL